MGLPTESRGRPRRPPLQIAGGSSLPRCESRSLFLAFSPARWHRNLATFAFAVIAILAVVLAAVSARADSARLDGYLKKVSPSVLDRRATRVGPAAGKPAMAPLFQGDKLIGHAFLNSDIVDAIGYSGKPIHVLVGIDLDGRITGLKLVKHSEPIVLVGIPEAKIVKLLQGYVGKKVVSLAREMNRSARSVDIVSGATVTIMVIDDSVIRSALHVYRLRAGGTAKLAPTPARKLDTKQTAKKDWITLVGDGSVRRLKLTVGDINAAFTKAGHQSAIIRPDEAKPETIFIDLYAALVSVPSIGRSLLGDSEYGNLKRRLRAGQHAILLFANGRYSFRGSGFVRGGIFDRIQLIQGENNVRFRDKQYKRIGDIVGGAPRFQEIALFRIPPKAAFRADKAWRIQLLVARPVGPIEKAFLTFDLGYLTPAKLFLPLPKTTEKTKPQQAALPKNGSATPLWMRLWQQRTVDIAILLVALGVLTAIFFFQDALVRRPKWSRRIRTGFLLFTLVWLGFVANAQLSVVNTVTFSNALISGFRWEYFLTDPLVFILWCSVAAGLLFWGRGPFCGWLCPFGAMQELLNKVAKLVRIPQIRVPWAVHERLWPIKYLIFLGIFGVSFYSLTLAEQLAEVEPFKTAIILKFAREWWFVLFAVALLAIGLFIERFYCRYLCPLGAALAIPGKLRMFEWLRRYKECGNPCQTCANSCMVQAIHPLGNINPNECLYCLHCQEVYYDDHLCPVMIEKRRRRERRQAISSPDESFDFLTDSAQARAGHTASNSGAVST